MGLGGCLSYYALAVFYTFAERLDRSLITCDAKMTGDLRARCNFDLIA